MLGCYITVEYLQNKVKRGNCVEVEIVYYFVLSLSPSLVTKSYEKTKNTEWTFFLTDTHGAGLSCLMLPAPLETGGILCFSLQYIATASATAAEAKANRIKAWFPFHITYSLLKAALLLPSSLGSALFLSSWLSEYYGLVLYSYSLFCLSALMPVISLFTQLSTQLHIVGNIFRSFCVMCLCFYECHARHFNNINSLAWLKKMQYCITR